MLTLDQIANLIQADLWATACGGLREHGLGLVASRIQEVADSDSPSRQMTLDAWASAIRNRRPMKVMRTSTNPPNTCERAQRQWNQFIKTES